MGGAEEWHKTRSWTHVKLLGEVCEVGLTVDGGKDVKGELFWLFYDDVFSGWIPWNHTRAFHSERTMERTDEEECIKV